MRILRHANVVSQSAFPPPIETSWSIGRWPSFHPPSRHSLSSQLEHTLRNAMGQNERMWSQDLRISQCESPPPLLSALQRGQRAEAPIYKFVLTGGPCAGKTTSLDRLSTYFRCVCATACPY